MKNSLVSIITPLYNADRFISQTIQSVLAQTHQNWEMVIVDDCSTDNSVDIIQGYIKKDSRIMFIQLTKNSGAAIARNTAIEKASGRYIAFLDADDLWLPQKLEEQIKFMDVNNLSFTYSSYTVIDENNNNIGQFITKAEITYQSLLKTCSVGCLTAIYDTKKIGKMLMPNILKRQDYGLWLNILKQIKQTKGMLTPLASYRILDKSLSSNKINVSQYQWKIYREIEKLSIAKSVYYFIQYAYFGFFKYKNK